MKTTTICALVLGLACSSFSGSVSANRFTGSEAIGKVDAEQIVRAAILAQYPGVHIEQVKTQSGSVSQRRYSVVVLDAKTKAPMRGTVTVDVRAWSPRAGIDRVSSIEMARPRKGSEVAQLDEK